MSPFCCSGSRCRSFVWLFFLSWHVLRCTIYINNCTESWGEQGKDDFPQLFTLFSSFRQQLLGIPNSLWMLRRAWFFCFVCYVSLLSVVPHHVQSQQGLHHVPFNGLWEYLCQRELSEWPKFIRNIILPSHYQIKLCTAAFRITLYIFFVDKASSDPAFHVSSRKLVEYQ